MVSVNSDPLPFCCGVRVLGEASPSDGRRGSFSKDLADALKSHKNEEEGKACLIYTTIPDQRAEVKALKAAGFRVVKRFKNPRTDNVVSVHIWTKPNRRSAAPRKRRLVRR